MTGPRRLCLRVLSLPWVLLIPSTHITPRHHPQPLDPEVFASFVLNTTVYLGAGVDVPALAQKGPSSGLRVGEGYSEQLLKRQLRGQQ